MVFDFSLITNIAVFLINAIDIWLIFLIYSANSKKKINKTFIMMAFFMLIWVDFAYFARLSSQSNVALFWIKIAWAVTIPLFATLYFFVIHFIKEEKKHKILNKIVLSIGVFSFFITLFTDLIVKDIKSKQVWSKLIYGDAIMVFYGLVLFLSFLILFFLLKKYFHFSKVEKVKTQYFLIGILIFLFMNMVFNIIYPFFLGISKYYQLGDYSTVVPLCFIAYAITRHKLMGIKPLLSSILVALIAILLALDIFIFTPNFFLQLFKGLIFVIFLYFGYLLVKSVLDKIKRSEELERLDFELARANAELKRISRSKTEFISMASHQLRTPLAAIKGYSSMLVEGDYGKFEKKGERVLKNILISTERLIKIINDLLNISRLELGKLKLEKNPCEIEEIIENVYKEMKPRSQQKKLNFIWKKPKISLPKINIDELKIRQVLYNIVDNAIKYTNSGNISITLKPKQKGRVIIEIRDTGEGLTMEEQSKIFQSFTRGAAGFTYWVQGTGLGLHLAKKFVEMHHGRIWVESQGKGKGSTFYIELPVG